MHKKRKEGKYNQILKLLKKSNFNKESIFNLGVFRTY